MAEVPEEIVGKRRRAQIIIGSLTHSILSLTKYVVLSSNVSSPFQNVSVGEQSQRRMVPKYNFTGLERRARIHCKRVRSAGALRRRIASRESGFKIPLILKSPSAALDLLRSFYAVIYYRYRTSRHKPLSPFGKRQCITHRSLRLPL